MVLVYISFLVMVISVSFLLVLKFVIVIRFLFYGLLCYNVYNLCQRRILLVFHCCYGLTLLLLLNVYERWVYSFLFCCLIFHNGNCYRHCRPVYFLLVSVLLVCVSVCGNIPNIPVSSIFVILACFPIAL